MTSSRASTFEVAQMTKSPVVLVAPARGAALSVLALIQGFLQFMPESRICGVILNSCTAMTYAPLARAIEERFGIRALGFLPQIPDCALESRHLGLVTAAEVAHLREKMQRLAQEAEKSIDLDGLLKLARAAEPVSYAPYVPPRFARPVRIGVARDNAFCFYYEDSLELLTRLGAELVPLSPLEDTALPAGLHGLCLPLCPRRTHMEQMLICLSIALIAGLLMEDTALPAGLHGLCLGGGYPELYARQLSENKSMRESIRRAVTGGLPCIAECGGFMYLTEKIADFPMAGVLRGGCRDMGRLTRFGYVRLTARQDTLLCRAGQSIPAHEFHHWDADDTGNAFTAEKPSGRSWPCVHATETLYAGFPHFHFYANPDFAVRFYEACQKEESHAEKNQTDGDRGAQL